MSTYRLYLKRSFYVILYLRRAQEIEKLEILKIKAWELLELWTLNKSVFFIFSMSYQRGYAMYYYIIT